MKDNGIAYEQGKVRERMQAGWDLKNLPKWVNAAMFKFSCESMELLGVTCNREFLSLIVGGEPNNMRLVQQYAVGTYVLSGSIISWTTIPESLCYDCYILKRIQISVAYFVCATAVLRNIEDTLYVMKHDQETADPAKIDEVTPLLHALSLF